VKNSVQKRLGERAMAIFSAHASTRAPLLAWQPAGKPGLHTQAPSPDSALEVGDSWRGLPWAAALWGFFSCLICHGGYFKPWSGLAVLLARLLRWQHYPSAVVPLQTNPGTQGDGKPLRAMPCSQTQAQGSARSP